MPGLISARLMLDQSNVIFNRSNLFFDLSKIVQRVFKNLSFSHVLHYFKTFQKLFGSLSSTNPPQPNFFRFLPIFSQRFLSLRIGKTILPFLFWFNLIFHAFKGKFRTYRNLGFLVFFIISYKIDQWVFVVE